MLPNCLAAFDNLDERRELPHTITEELADRLVGFDGLVFGHYATMGCISLSGLRSQLKAIWALFEVQLTRANIP